MSKNDLNIADLEENAGQTVATEATKKEKKVVSPEDVAERVSGVAKMQEFGVTENLAKILPLVAVWHLDADAQKETKEAVAASFGGAEKLKDYADTDLPTDISVFAGLQKAVSVLNNVKSFYARRNPGATTSKKKVAMSAITISGEPYSVSAEYLAEIANEPRESKVALLLAHPATKKNEAIETL